MNRLAIYTGCLSLMIFMLLINYYNLNFPIADDYAAYLNFLNNFVQAGDFKSKALIIMQQHVDHRIVIARLVVLAYYKFCGSLDFRNLLYISQALMLLLILPLTWLLNKANANYKTENLVLAMCLVIFPSMCSAYVWLSVTLQQDIQMLFSLLSIVFIIRLEDNRTFTNYIFYIICMICNVFSESGWIILFTSVLIYHLLRKNKLEFILNFIFFAIMAIIFFKIIPYTLLSHPFGSVLRLFLFILGFTGSTFFTGIPYVSQVVGFILIILLLYNRQVIKNNNVYLIWFLFFFCNALIIGIGRVGIGSLGTDDRYAIYSLINLGFTINLLSKNYSFLRYDKFWITLIIILIIAFVRELPDGGPYKSYQEAKFTINYPDILIAERIYSESRKLGIYTNPIMDYHITNFSSIDYNEPLYNNLHGDAKLYSFRIDDQANYILLSGRLHVDEFDINRSVKYIVLRSNKREYWFKMDLSTSPTSETLYKLTGKNYSHFSSVSYIKDILPGDYAIKLYLVDGKIGGFINVNDRIPINLKND